MSGGLPRVILYLRRARRVRHNTVEDRSMLIMGQISIISETEPLSRDEVNERFGDVKVYAGSKILSAAQPFWMCRPMFWLETPPY